MKTLESYAGVPHLKSDSSYNAALKRLSRSTQNGTASSFGGFSALFDIGKLKLKDPLLVATTDGVGTKLEIANLQGKHDTIGQDLVAMCVNDLITCGAKPVFFLDYFASGAFNRRRTVEVVRGIANGCREAGCALVGGETAIMPGFYPGAKYDLAGFAVGVVEKSKVINGKSVRAGDLLIGLESSGFHSNGYSLLRKVFTQKELAGKIGRELLIPTHIYVKPVLALAKAGILKAAAHITGGGFYDNLPRVIPSGLGTLIEKGSWPRTSLFDEVQKRARYSERQMYHTFNMGIGMVAVVSPAQANQARQILNKLGMRSSVIGVIKKGNGVVIG